MKNIITIAKKEVRSYFNSPIAYVVALVFLLLWEFLFFRNVFLIGEVSLSGLFDLLPWIFMIVIPALTMGSLAEEKSEGTLEFLLTHPLSQIELIVGKFLGIVSYFALTLLFIFPLAWSFNHFGNLDWGVVWAQYAASILLMAVLVSLGILVSSFFSSVIAAFLVAAVINFFLIIVGTEFFSSRFSLGLTSFLEQLSISNHFNSMSRGVIDLRDVWYFVSMVSVFLSFAYLNLIKNKYGNKKSVYRNYQIAGVLLIGIVILSNMVGTAIPGRADLTAEKKYTLSPATKDMISRLPDMVNISLYASDALPAQLQPVLRETKDILADYQRFSKGKINIVNKNPSEDSQIAKEASSRGIDPVRFNVVSQEEFQMKEGYLGMAISYGGKNESIPFVQDVNDLEYQLSSLINKLTIKNKPKVGFISGHGEKNTSSDLSLISGELKKQFEIVDIVAKGEDETEAKKNPLKNNTNVQAQTKNFSIPEDVKTIVIASPQEDYSDQEKKVLSDFISQGGNVMFAVDGVTVSAQTLTASAGKNNLIDYIKNEIGVEIKKDMVYDLRSNESVSFGGGQMNYILPYPVWIRALRATSDSIITSKISSVTLPWASSLEVNKSILDGKGLEENDLLVTSNYAGSESGPFNISPNNKFSSQDLGKKLMAVAVSPKNDSGAGRMIIVGDADFMSNQNVQSSPENLGFGLGAIAWLSQESTLSQIKIKNLADRKFLFNNEADSSWIKLGNLALIFMVISGYGSWRFMRRKRMKDDAYQI